jgi:hypothetical protein
MTNPEDVADLVSFYDDSPVAELHSDPATENPTLVHEQAPAVDPAQQPLEGDDREQLLMRAATNLDSDGKPHFLRVLQGRAGICGTDGEPWPCATFVAMEAEQRKRTGQAPEPGATTEIVNLDDVAAALGMSRAELDQRMEQGDAVDLGAEDFNGLPDTGR